MLFHRIPASAVCSRFKLCCPPCQLRRRLSLDGEGADAGARGPVLCNSPLAGASSTTDLDQQNSTARTFSASLTAKWWGCVTEFRGCGCQGRPPPTAPAGHSSSGSLPGGAMV